MKIICKFDQTVFPPKISLFIHGPIHYRQSKKMHDWYREQLNNAWQKAGYPFMIDYPVDIEVGFIDPPTPDAVNCMIALTRVLDGKTRKAILKDDGLLSRTTYFKFYPNGKTKSEHRIP